jgi:hypothetical protein
MIAEPPYSARMSRYGMVRRRYAWLLLSAILICAVLGLAVAFGARPQPASMYLMAAAIGASSLGYAHLAGWTSSVRVTPNRAVVSNPFRQHSVERSAVSGVVVDHSDSRVSLVLANGLQLPVFVFGPSPTQPFGRLPSSRILDGVDALYAMLAMSPRTAGQVHVQTRCRLANLLICAGVVVLDIVAVIGLYG